MRKNENMPPPTDRQMVARVLLWSKRPLRGKHLKLLEQPEHVPREPDFFNLFVCYAIHCNTRDHDPLFSLAQRP